MAYMIRITRKASSIAITLDEWIAAVNAVADVRLAEGDYAVTLPETGQVFTLRNNGGDAEIRRPESGDWRRVFRWDDDDVAFVRTETFADDADCHLRVVARQLAQALQAHTVGDDGERYV